MPQFSEASKEYGFYRYLKNTSWMMVEQFLRIIAGLFVGIWVARYLGPEQFGLFSYVLAFTAIFGGIAKLGLDGIMVRELVNHPEKRDTYLGTAFWLKVISAFIVMGLMAAIVPFTSNDTQTNLFIFIIAAGLLFQSFEVVEFYFQSQVLAKIVSICKVTQLALSSAIKIYLVLNEAELIWFVLVTAFDALSLAVSYFIAYKINQHNSFYKNFDLSIAQQLLKDSWPLIISAFVIMLYMRIDQIMIKQLLGVYEVGLYSAALRISEAVYFIPMIISASLFPAILSARKKDPILYKKRLSGLYSLLIWIAILIAVPITFLSDWIVLNLFGQDYASSSSVIVIHIWASIFVFLGVAYSKYLLAENLNATFLTRNAIALILNMILNLFLIPLYGIVGAAMATLISQAYTALLHDLVVKKFRDDFFIKIKSFTPLFIERIKC